MSRSRSLSVATLLAVSVAWPMWLSGCGDGDRAGAGRPEATRVADGATGGGGRAADEPTAAERAAKARAAKRKRAAAAAERAEARDQKRGQGLLQGLIDAGTRDTWSIMDVTAKGGDVTVYTDLPPGSPGFTGACEALKAKAAWIETIGVHGTDGASHATWTAGDAACAAV